MKKLAIIAVLMVLSLPLWADVAESEATPADSREAFTRVGVLLNDDLWYNFDEIQSYAVWLEESQRDVLYRRHESDLLAPFLINAFLGFGIGSFVQGDVAGGAVGVIGEVGTIGLMTYGAFRLDQQLMAVGAVGYLLARGFQFIRPFAYSSSYNNKLTEALNPVQASLETSFAPVVFIDTAGNIRAGISTAIKF